MTAPALILAVALLAPTSRPTTPEELAAQDRAEVAEQRADYGPVRQDAAEWLDLAIVDGRLDFSVLADAPAGVYTVPVERGDEVVPARARLRTLPGDLAVSVLDLDLWESGEEATTPAYGVGPWQRNLAVNGDLRTGRVHLTGYGRSGEASYTVDVIQAGVGEVPEGEQGVTLHVSVLPDAGAVGVQELRETHRAADVATLLSEQRPLVVRHVLPVLRGLGFGGVADEAVRETATLLFARDLPVTDGQRAATLAAVEGFASDAFADRLAAQKALDSLGRPAATVLLTADDDWRATLTSEQAARVDTFLEPWRREADAALLDDPAFLEAVRQLEGGPEDAALREAARGSSVAPH